AIVPYGTALAVAASNSPRSTVLSGDPEAIDALCNELAKSGIFYRRVKVDFAAHSPHLDEIGAQLTSALEGIKWQKPKIPLYSSVTGGLVDGMPLGGQYWHRNLRQTVLFSQAVHAMLSHGFDLFLELSAHPILTTGLRECIAHVGGGGLVISSLRRDEPEKTA